jgi:hypothetical protein
LSQPHAEQDPLLEFSTEPGAPPAPAPPRTASTQPVAAAVVSQAPPSKNDALEEVQRLRARIDRLEKVVEQSSRDLRWMKSEVATLVGAAQEFRGRPRRVVMALAGVTLGVAAGVWLWINLAAAPIVPAPPVAIASEPPAPALPTAPEQPPAVAAPEAAPAIVPVAATIDQVQDPPSRVTPPRVDYVGTLTIDAAPAGNVFIDRKAAGRTPLRVENLKAGSHLVWIERDGYRRFTRVVLVPSDKVTRLVADLEPAQR